MLSYLLITGRFLETAMLICFGCSWPISIFKSWRTKFVRGKSIAFMVLIFVGYLAGTGAKFFRAVHAGQPPEWNTSLYILNVILVAIDISLYVKYRRNHEPVMARAAREIARMDMEEKSRSGR